MRRLAVASDYLFPTFRDGYVTLSLKFLLLDPPPLVSIGHNGQSTFRPVLNFTMNVSFIDSEDTITPITKTGDFLVQWFSSWQLAPRADVVALVKQYFNVCALTQDHAHLNDVGRLFLPDAKPFEESARNFLAELPSDLLLTMLKSDPNTKLLN